MNSEILMNSSVQKVNGIKHVVVLSNVLHSVPSSPRARPSSPSRVRWAAPKSPRRFVNCSLVCMDGKGCTKKPKKVCKLQFGLYGWEGLQSWWFRTGIHRPEPSVRYWRTEATAEWLILLAVTISCFVPTENKACLFVMFYVLMRSYLRGGKNATGTDQ